MTLQSSGTITAAQINVELRRAAGAAFSLNDTETRELAEKPSGLISFSDFYGKTYVIKKTVSASVNNLILQNLFTTEEWSASAPKEVIINSGVIIGATTPTVASVRTGSAVGGTLKLTNNGAIQGAGGLPNSGTGGTAIQATTPISIYNYGAIRAGGGAGGRGGTGGTGGGGDYLAYEPTSGWLGNSNNMWRVKRTFVIVNPKTSEGIWQDAGYTMIWNNVVLLNPNSGGVPASWTSGIYTYYRGSVFSNGDTQSIGPSYQIRRSHVVNTAGGAGGGGGSGGTGQGFGGTYSTGLAGAVGALGGTNAGRGGTGGTGGNGGGWAGVGGTGLTGAAGANGNRTNGLAGAGGVAGGQPGAAVSGSQATVVVVGTINGAY